MIVEDCEGTRLDSYLSLKLDISRSKAQKYIKDGNVLVNQKEVSSSYLVKLQDVVEIDEDYSYEVSVEPEDIPLDIIYEDEDLLIINKVSGMVVHPAPGHYTGTLVNALLYCFNLAGGEAFRPGIVHRLDKDTSGVIVVAKNEWAHEKLSTMIAKKEVERKYLAIVSGVIKHDTGTVDAPIGRDRNNRQKMAVTDVNGKDAVTHFRVLERFEQNTLIECKLETGRTHQIRVHMAYIGFPVLNDPLYGKGKTTDFGQMLHSKSIRFHHPRTGKEIYFEVDTPKEFQEELEKLRKNERI